jgi:hypothetical protein
MKNYATNLLNELCHLCQFGPFPSSFYIKGKSWVDMVKRSRAGNILMGNLQSILREYSIHF